MMNNPNKDAALKVCIINPNYYRSSGVTSAINRLVKGVRDCPECSLDWFLVSCLHGEEKDDIDENLSNFRLMRPWTLNFWADVIPFIKYLKRNEIDIIHVHHRRLAMLLSVFCKPMGIPIVYTGHLVYSPSQITRLVRFNGGIAISKSVYDDMINHMRFKHLSIISNAVYFPDVINYAFPRKKEVVCIGRLEEVKNHKTLLKAWANSKLYLKGWKLRLFGEGSLKSELQQLCLNLSINESVIFEGFSSNIVNDIKGASFAVLASLVEGQGLVTIEASTAGIPSLVSNVEGSRDLIPPHAKMPNLFEPMDYKKLSEMLVIWASSNDDLDKEALVFGEYLRTIASQKLVTKQTYDFYKAVLNKEIS